MSHLQGLGNLSFAEGAYLGELSQLREGKHAKKVHHQLVAHPRTPKLHSPCP